MWFSRPAIPFRRQDWAILSWLSCCLASWMLVHAGDPMDEQRQAALALSQEIDRQIVDGLHAIGISPAPQASDAEYLRRVTLDLAGRIPTAREALEFEQSDGVDKRIELVERMLDSADFPFHMRNELDILWLARLQWNNEWRTYLLDAVREQRPLDAVVREILVPETYRPGDKGAVAFLRQRVNDLDALTNDSSSLLFGVNIACAKCHDHPLAPDWQQDDYYGYAAFFKRTFGTRRGLLAERFDGELKFTTIKGEDKRARFMFLDGHVVDEPDVARTQEQWKAIRDQLKKAEQDDKADPPPQPDFSPREALVRMAFATGSQGADSRLDAGSTSEPTDAGAARQPLVARNLANRLWARFMGRGLVHPLDQMHSGNAASHPELLDRLTDALLAHRYDPRPIIEAIVLSQAYSRSARWPASTTAPSPEAFAVAMPRPLSPFQYSLSLWLASRNPDQLPGLEKPRDWLEKRKQWEQRSEGLARRLEIPGELFQVGVEEALMLSNNPQTEQDFLANSPDTLVGHLGKIENDDQLVETLYRSILSRSPSDQERATILDYINNRPGKRPAALGQIVWALLTSAEFRFNY